MDRVKRVCSSTDWRIVKRVCKRVCNREMLEWTRRLFGVKLWSGLDARMFWRGINFGMDQRIVIMKRVEIKEYVQ